MTIASLALTLYYPNRTSPTTTITIRAPQFGDAVTLDRRDVIQESAAGELIVYERGPRRFLVEFDFAYLPLSERNDLLNFFADVVNGASKEWDMRVPNYGDKVIKLYALANIAGSSESAGAGYTANQLTTAPYIFFTSCSFEASALGFAQPRDSWFDTQFRFRAKQIKL